MSEECKHPNSKWTEGSSWTTLIRLICPDCGKQTASAGPGALEEACRRYELNRG